MDIWVYSNERVVLVLSNAHSLRFLWQIDSSCIGNVRGTSTVSRLGGLGAGMVECGIVVACIIDKGGVSLAPYRGSIIKNGLESK